MRFLSEPRLWTSEEVAMLEARIDQRLPADYRDHLLTVGAGPIPERIVPGTGGNGLVHNVLTFDDAQILLDATSTHYELIPERYRPAVNGDGGAFCVGLRDDVVGRMFWADFDLADTLGLDEGTRSEQIMSLRYDTWNEFIADLETWELV